MKSIQKSFAKITKGKFLFVIIVSLFFTSCRKEIPTVSTNPVTNIERTSATGGGKVMDDGNVDVSVRGVCWSTNQSPSITDSKTADGSGIGTFTSSITMLTPGTTYYVKAYATNSEGTGYGNVESFTSGQPIIPTLTTTAATSITLTAAVSGGNITSDGGGAVNARGICWATTVNPTVSDSKTSDGTGTGVFPSNLTGLLPGTTYHVRAYATNSAGTAYGNDVTFITVPVVVPTLTTTPITSITSTTASSGGNITADGGGAITARGVCWATTINPTISNSKTTNGTGTGVFTSSITGLAASTTYYVRAYATNSAGTGYGSSVSFSTPAYQPIIWFQGISKTFINVRGNTVAVGQLTINAPTAGKVIVHFDGSCIPSSGDRIVLAASDQVNWTPNDGNVSVYNIEGSFSHTRVYTVAQGINTFYAVAQNYVQQSGSGIASIYGSLTVEFFPSGINTFISNTGINRTSINVRGSSVAVGQLTINAPTAGKVLVHFDGSCSPSVGDRIVLAASNQINWTPNDGNVSIYNTEGNFSHTRVYDVTPGNNTFYAVAQNYVEQSGSGVASIYGSLTVEFFPTGINTFVSYTGISKTAINVRGSAVAVGQLTINAPAAGKVLVHFNGKCYPASGDNIVLAASDILSWDVNDGNVSVYNTEGSFSHTRVYNVTQGNHTFYAVAQNYVNQGGSGIASIYSSLTVEFIPDN
jgi:hypothetical protein